MTSSAQAFASTLSSLQKNEGLAFRKAFSSQHIEEVFARHQVEFRDRNFPPDVTLMAFCSQLLHKKMSCYGIVQSINRDRFARGLTLVSESTSAYCQARKRLPLNLIKELAIETGKKLEQESCKSWLWKGHHIKLIDGSTLSMPDSAENQAVWPQHNKQAEGVGFPLMRIVGMLSLATGACLGLSYGPYAGEGSGEHPLCRQLLPVVEPNDIILADGYYSSYFLLAQLLQRKAHMITRLHGGRKYDFRRGTRLGEGDHIVELIKPPKPKWMDDETYEGIPNTLKLREMKSGHKGSAGRECIIVTTLLEPKQYSRTEVLSAYQLRWNVELDLRALKTVMGMDILSCKSPEMIEKEVWTYILTYNLVKQLVCEAAVRAKVEARRISFSAAITAFQLYAPLIIYAENPNFAKRMYDGMIYDISRHIIPHRPGRSEPRAVKRRAKVYPRLKKPRSAYKNASKLT